MTAYIVSSIAWAVLGLLTGYALGRSTRAAVALEGAAVTETPPAPDDDVRPATHRFRWASIAPTGDQILGVVVVLLAIASVTVMAVSLSKQQAEIDRAHSSIECLTKYTRDNIAATGAGRQAAVIEREANRSILEQAFSGRLGPASLFGWNAEVQRADDVRAATPYPMVPSCAAVP